MSSDGFPIQPKETKHILGHLENDGIRQRHAEGQDSTGGQARRSRCFTDSASRAAEASAMTSARAPGGPFGAAWVVL